jgi:hypothetical protein
MRLNSTIAVFFAFSFISLTSAPSRGDLIGQRRGAVRPAQALLDGSLRSLSKVSAATPEVKNFFQTMKKVVADGRLGTRFGFINDMAQATGKFGEFHRVGKAYAKAVDTLKDPQLVNALTSDVQVTIGSLKGTGSNVETLQCWISKINKMKISELEHAQRWGLNR